MDLEVFDVHFPEIAEKETRTITIDNPLKVGIPSDKYVFREFYCTRSDCDCRRVLFNVESVKHEKIVATIGFGWADEAYYKKWFGLEDDEDETLVGTDIIDLIGPALEPLAAQSKIASDILNLVTKKLITDEIYVERLKNHYAMFKAKFDNKFGNRKIRRNEFCSCGSGKKYKKCCGS